MDQTKINRKSSRGVSKAGRTVGGRNYKISCKTKKLLGRVEKEMEE